MVWSVDMDDFRGYCGTGKYPLIKTMKAELNDYLVEMVYEGPFETTRVGSQADVNPDEVVCEEGDAHVSFYRDKADCSMYYVCKDAVKHHKPCPTGLVFDENENICDWPENVVCEEENKNLVWNNFEPTTTPTDHVWENFEPTTTFTNLFFESFEPTVTATTILTEGLY